MAMGILRHPCHWALSLRSGVTLEELGGKGAAQQQPACDGVCWCDGVCGSKGLTRTIEPERCVFFVQSGSRGPWGSVWDPPGWVPFLSTTLRSSLWPPSATLKLTGPAVPSEDIGDLEHNKFPPWKKSLLKGPTSVCEKALLKGAPQSVPVCAGIAQTVPSCARPGSAKGDGDEPLCPTWAEPTPHGSPSPLGRSPLRKGLGLRALKVLCDGAGRGAACELLSLGPTLALKPGGPVGITPPRGTTTTP